MRTHEATPSQRFGLGRWRFAPHVCFVSRKPCIRTFLADTLAELGFVTGECGDDELAAAAADEEIPSDIVVIVQSLDDSSTIAPLRTLAAARFDGMVMLIGGCHPIANEAQQFGKQLGLNMLPVLDTPIRAEELAARIRLFIRDGRSSRGPLSRRPQRLTS